MNCTWHARPQSLKSSAASGIRPEAKSADGSRCCSGRGIVERENPFVERIRSRSWAKLSVNVVDSCGFKLTAGHNHKKELRKEQLHSFRIKEEEQFLLHNRTTD